MGRVWSAIAKRRRSQVRKSNPTTMTDILQKEAAEIILQLALDMG